MKYRYTGDAVTGIDLEKGKELMLAPGMEPFKADGRNKKIKNLIEKRLLVPADEVPETETKDETNNKEES